MTPAFARSVVVAGTAIALLTGSAATQTSAPDIVLPDTAVVLPPPPPPYSAADKQDQRTFKANRALEGTARWTLAAVDAETSVEAGLAGFSCAAGRQLSRTATPATAAVFDLVQREIPRVVNPPKDLYKKPRPPVRQKGDTCVARADWMYQTPTYPSGHTTLGWSRGLVLAELLPARSTELLRRARTYGESRIVCGVHYLSDVQAGYMNGGAFVAGLHGDDAFRRALDRARAELASAPPTPPDPAVCKLEADAASASVQLDP